MLRDSLGQPLFQHSANKKDYHDFHSECDSADDYEACRWRICTTHTSNGDNANTYAAAPGATARESTANNVQSYQCHEDDFDSANSFKAANDLNPTYNPSSTDISDSYSCRSPRNACGYGCACGSALHCKIVCGFDRDKDPNHDGISSNRNATMTEGSSTIEEKRTQEIGILKANVQELDNQLEVSRQRNRICQRKLDYAYKSHEKDGDKLKELTEGHTILKEELSSSKAMLDGFKVFMGQQQEQLIELKHAGDLKTSELTETQTALMDKMKLRHRQQHQRSQERIKQLEQANMECNAKAVKYHTILRELKAYMKDQLIYSEAFIETKGNNTSSDWRMCG
ncbi:unnamed protein product [Albugo candida]|uniref:Uncharacterized protein n=1 Tax=Albugo candida TaxID=65357 RepID=A0A024GFA2_9STRA|nr:unnamed protein product [Albugo candida]|eukprot:CCI45223.1 unnamed protein product [Albugo candida]